MTTAFTTLKTLSNVILDESSSPQHLRHALEQFTNICSEVSGIVPDPSYDAWADDTFLESGLAINPKAAAQCILDYQRSTIFIRGVYAAIKTAQDRRPNTPISILYAGCGPYATLLLPVLTQFEAGELVIQLLDIHQVSLDSASNLITHFGLSEHNIQYQQGDACHYKHHNPLHLIIAEVMQKALEQEPQFSVTANLAPQLDSQGIFIPENIDIELCLVHLKQEQTLLESDQNLSPKVLAECEDRHPLGTLLSLNAVSVSPLLQEARQNAQTEKLELPPVSIQLPNIKNITSYDVVMLTRIRVFERFELSDYETDLTRPALCHELQSLSAGSSFVVRYQLGNYPRFNFDF